MFKIATSHDQCVPSLFIMKILCDFFLGTSSIYDWSCHRTWWCCCCGGKKNIPIFTHKQCVISLQIKRKFVRHVPRMSTDHLNIGIVGHLDSWTIGQLDSWQDAEVKKSIENKSCSACTSDQHFNISTTFPASQLLSF